MTETKKEVLKELKNDYPKETWEETDIRNAYKFCSPYCYSNCNKDCNKCFNSIYFLSLQARGLTDVN